MIKSNSSKTTIFNPDLMGRRFTYLQPLGPHKKGDFIPFGLCLTPGHDPWGPSLENEFITNGDTVSLTGHTRVSTATDWHDDGQYTYTMEYREVITDNGTRAWCSWWEYKSSDQDYPSGWAPSR